MKCVKLLSNLKFNKFKLKIYSEFNKPPTNSTRHLRTVLIDYDNLCITTNNQP